MLASSVHEKMNIIKKLANLIDCKVIFTTPDGEFEGILKFITIRAEHATFEHVFLIPSRDYMGTMHVSFFDISSCELLEPAHRILDVSKFDSSKELLNAGESIDENVIVEIDDGKDFIDYLPSYLKNKVPSDRCIIDSMQCMAFSNAVNHLSQLSTIGVSFHGANVSRFGNFSWICISSPDCVFLFDIEELGMKAFQKGLKRLFEAENIEKVIHDCREAADCLRHKFNVKLNNVFDTQVADFLINMQMYTGSEIFKYVSSLDTCLVKYLNVPQQFLYNKKHLSLDEEVKFFQIRPISEELTNVLRKSSMYLATLKKKQEKILLNPFEQAVQLYLDVLRGAPDSKVFREPTEFTQCAPAYLLETVKFVRFQDTLDTTGYSVDNIVNLNGHKIFENTCTEFQSQKESNSSKC